MSRPLHYPNVPQASNSTGVNSINPSLTLAVESFDSDIQDLDNANLPPDEPAEVPIQAIHNTTPFTTETPSSQRLHRRIIYYDLLPEGPGDLDSPAHSTIDVQPVLQTHLTITIPPRRRIINTVANCFGLFRSYFERPNHLPDLIQDINAFAARSTQLHQPKATNQMGNSSLGPCGNPSVFGFQYWWWVFGGSKTIASRKKLIDLLCWEKFRLSDLVTANLHQIDAALGQPLENNDQESRSYLTAMKDGWQEYSVNISVPIPKHRSVDPHASSSTTTSAIPSYTFPVPGLHLRSLTSVICDAVKRPGSHSFHWLPFEQHWHSGRSDQRVYDELYTSNAWLNAHRDIQELPVPNCKLPRAIVALMFWSDSTCLSEFGTKSLWPIYLFFGNQSKYERSRPSNHAGHHIAFLPSVSPSTVDILQGY